MSQQPSVDLADTIRVLRHQLSEAMHEGQDQELRFEIGEVQLEFEIVVKKDASADGGIRFGVISLGAKANIGNEASHRISLVMQPVVLKADGSTSRANISGTGRSKPL
jgi:hypothetical protein